MTFTQPSHRAGAVLFRQTDAEFEVMLISSETGVWRLPQTALKPGESAAASAQRAALEAVGLCAFSGPHLDQIEYRSHGALTRVDYHLLRALTTDLAQLGWEVDAAEWVGIDAAIGKAGYATERDMLTRARSLLRSPGGSARLLPPLLAHLLGDLPPTTLLALAETDLWVEDEHYVVVAVPSEEGAEFLADLGDIAEIITIDDGDEFTIILPESGLSGHASQLLDDYQTEPNRRFIRLEATLPWDTVGYGAAIFAALAAAGISAGFYSGYSIDYLLVSAADLDLAVAALEALIAEAETLTELG